MDYYSQIASGYDELHGEEQDRKLQSFLEKVHLKPGITLLDVGCGTGRSMRSLDDVHWYGLEPSAGLIQYANHQARNRITLGSAEEIPWPDGSFDAILSLTALQNFTDARQGLLQMQRVAKPNAIILLSFLRKSALRDQLQSLIRSEFAIIDEWEEQQDLMFICRNK